MEVILLKNTDFGDKGAVIKVANGYARNFLIPNGVAVEKTVGNSKHVAEVATQRKKKVDRERAEVEALAKKITAAKMITIKAKGREDGALFGAITHQQIVDLLKEHLEVTIDRRRVQLRAIKEAGTFEVPLKLTFGITATAKIKVELEVEKKKGEDEKKTARRKPRKKEEILSEIEAKEAEAKAPEAEKAE